MFFKTKIKKLYEYLFNCFLGKKIPEKELKEDLKEEIYIPKIKQFKK